MSFVVAAMKNRYAIVAGDTQLNNESGSIADTGVIVFPLDDHTVIGLVGDYKGHLKTIEEIMAVDKSKMELSDLVSEIHKQLNRNADDYNGIIVRVNEGGTYFAVLSSHDGWGSGIQKSANREVKVLVPPDVKEEYCYSYITSLDNLKRQAINCVKTVGRKSESVNQKVFGAELTPGGIMLFTDGINYDDITVRIRTE